MTADIAAASADHARFPGRHITPWAYYDRAVWMLGEEGEDGYVVQGHDRRAWAALNAHVRAESLDRPGRGLFALSVRPYWVTFRTTCGCSDDQHAVHAAERKAALSAYTAARREGADLIEASEALSAARTCEDVTGNDDCMSLPPCETERMAWMFTRQDGEIPDGAAPILEVS